MVAAEYGSTFQIHDEGKGSVLFTAMSLANTCSRPGIVSSVHQADVDIDRFLDERGTLCIVTPSGEGDRFTPYFTALLTAIVHAAETRSAMTGLPLKPRLLLALDEAGNVFHYPRLPHLLTTSRGNGIQLLLAYHDLAQIEHLYGGREVAHTRDLRTPRRSPSRDRSSARPRRDRRRPARASRGICQPRAALKPILADLFTCVDRCRLERRHLLRGELEEALRPDRVVDLDELPQQGLIATDRLA